MNSRKVLAATLASTLTACITAQAAAQESAIEGRSARFAVRGSLAADRLRSIACDVQQALHALGVRDKVQRPLIPSIVAATNERQMWEVLPQFWERGGRRPLGAYWSGLYGHHIAIRVDTRPDERLRRVLHELAHFATHAMHAKPPRWLDEGLSELWEHAAIEGGHIEVGLPVERHVRALRSGKNWIAVADLVAAPNVLDEKSGAKAAMFYAQSWALVHYLLFEKSGGEEVMLDRLPETGELPTDEQLRAYAHGELASAVRIPIPAAGSECGEPFEIRAVSKVEGTLLRARALADGERPDAALPLLSELLRQNPDNPEALETLGFVHFIGNRHRDSAVTFDRLIGRGRASHVAYYYRAMLAGPIPALSDGSGPVPELEYLRQALRLEPGFRPALERLCELQEKVSGCVAA